MNTEHPRYVLSPESVPAEGSLIMFAGLAWYGDDFGDHGPLAGHYLRVNEHTSLGFYVTIEDARSPEDNGIEAFISIADEYPGTYFLLS